MPEDLNFYILNVYGENLKMEKENFQPGETLQYTGRGFIGFDPNNRACEFVSYENNFDAFIKYGNIQHSILVFRNEFKRAKFKNRKNRI